jgi:menaquinone-dependent protoporphyrinogen oxidase
MSNSILVAYATRAGSTVGIAEAIGRTLTNNRFDVTVQPIAQVGDLAAYDAVVVGSAIRYDRVMPEVKQFVEEHRQQLSQKPFAAFVVCLAMATQNEKRREQARTTASGYLQPIRTLVPTVSEGLFAGALNFSKLPIVYRVVFRVLTLTPIFNEGDHRDWEAIERWASDLSTQLSHSVAD